MAPARDRSRSGPGASGIGRREEAPRDPTGERQSARRETVVSAVALEETLLEHRLRDRQRGIFLLFILGAGARLDRGQTFAEPQPEPPRLGEPRARRQALLP